MSRTAHELDHRIVGDDMQCVEITLDPQETVLAEAGAFMMMDEGIEMKTIFGDGNGQEQSFMSKLWGAGKRVLVITHGWVMDVITRHIHHQPRSAILNMKRKNGESLWLTVTSGSILAL